MAFPVSVVVYAQLERCIVHKQQKETDCALRSAHLAHPISVSDNLMLATADHCLFKWSA